MPPSIRQGDLPLTELDIKTSLFQKIYNGLIFRLKTRPLGPGVTNLYPNGAVYSKILAVGYQNSITPIQCPGIFLVLQELSDFHINDNLSGICIGVSGPLWTPSVSKHSFAYRLDFRNDTTEPNYPACISWSKPFDEEIEIEGFDSIHFERDPENTEILGTDVLNSDFINKIDTSVLFHLLENLTKQGK